MQKLNLPKIKTHKCEKWLPNARASWNKKRTLLLRAWVEAHLRTQDDWKTFKIETLASIKKNINFLGREKVEMWLTTTLIFFFGWEARRCGAFKGQDGLAAHRMKPDS